MYLNFEQNQLVQQWHIDGEFKDRYCGGIETKLIRNILQLPLGEYFIDKRDRARLQRIRICWIDYLKSKNKI